MNKKLLIKNKFNYHYEIIESVIVKCREILNLDSSTQLDIYLHLSNKNVARDKLIPKNKKKAAEKALRLAIKQADKTSFINYITSKYPGIKLEKIKNYDYYINCTIYDEDFNNLDNNIDSKKKYISHEVTDRLKTNPNVYYLTPLSNTNYIYADVLPYSEKKKVSKVPIYVIQGKLNQGRRDLKLLNKILDGSYKHKFIIKLLGRGTLPEELERNKDKIILVNNLNFEDYHKEILDTYCILPLISKEENPEYYNNKLTSTINYARGYNLKCLIDEDLQKIYKLENVEIYKNINDITECFIKTLEEFYNNK